MKIIQINASYKPAYIYGGPTLSVAALSEGLVRKGIAAEVLTTTANGKEELSVKTNVLVLVDGVRVTYFKRLTKDHTHFSPGLLHYLIRQLKSLPEHEEGGLKVKNKKEKTDNCLNKDSPPSGELGGAVIHIHAWWNLVSVLSCFIAKWKNVPVVLSPRGTLSSYSFKNRNGFLKNLIHRFIGLPLLRYCHFHVSTEKEKQDILKILQPKSIIVIPNFLYLPPLNSSIVQQFNSTTNQPFKLLFLSRIEEKKGLDILFKALAALEIPFTLTIAGSGEGEYVAFMKQWAEELHISNRISWIGQQTQDEKWQVLQEHDLLFLPSYDESFANVVLESLAMGTPVLISKNVGLSDYIAQTDLGWICETTPDSIKETVLDAFKNQAKRVLIKNQAPGKVRDDFKEEKLIDWYISLYQDVLSANQHEK